VPQICHIRFTEGRNLGFNNLKCDQEMNDNRSKNLLPTHTLKTHGHNDALSISFCVTKGKKNQQSEGGGGMWRGNLFSILARGKQDRKRTSLASRRVSPCSIPSDTMWNLCSTKWHWVRCLSEQSTSFSPASIIPPVLHTHSSPTLHDLSNRLISKIT
jgi:hypothetical protein